MTAAYGYPPQAPPAYPPQFPPAPYPPQQYGPPPAPGYPPVQMAPPAAPLAQGSIDDFYNQPSTGGGGSLKFDQIGTRYVGIVTRALSSGDIQQQTDTRGVPQTFKDGRPKFVMKVPLQMQPSPAYPDGLAQWYVKGAARDELVRAMSEAGAPAGPPEQGAIIDITHTSLRQSGVGMNPAKLFHVVYTRPDGQTSSPAPAIAQPAVTPAQPSQFVQAAQPDLAALQAQQAAQFAAAQAAAQPAPVQQPVVQPQPPAPAASPQPPSDLSKEQQALLVKLTGG